MADCGVSRLGARVEGGVKSDMCDVDPEVNGSAADSGDREGGVDKVDDGLGVELGWSISCSKVP